MSRLIKIIKKFYEWRSRISDECEHISFPIPLSVISYPKQGFIDRIDKLVLGRNKYFIRYAENREPILKGKIMRERKRLLSGFCIYDYDILPTWKINPAERAHVYNMLAIKWSDRILHDFH